MNSNRPVVICATDFSEGASRAADVAAKIAVGSSEPLLIVHVSDSRDAAERAELRNRLDVEARRFSSGAAAEAMLLAGDKKAEAFLEFMHTRHVSLVVVGSETQGPVDRWVMGSFSEQVAQASSVPTLVLRNAAPFGEWSWTGRSLKVLAALDLQAGSDSVLRWLKDLGRAGPYEVAPCHVPAPRVPGDIGNESPEQKQHVQRELKKIVRDQLGMDAARVIVAPPSNEPAREILEIARKESADIIAVGTHQRHGLSRLFHGSVSRRLLHETGINVVCVPTSAAFDPRDAHIPEYRRVLVATDFSPLGNAAVPFACGACSVGGLVRIVHVEKPSLKRNRPSASELRLRLRELIPVETGSRCQPTEVEVLEDRTPARAICAEAERFGADLVCLSSHGRGASRAVHGSVAQAVLKKIHRPVLIIRRPEQ